MHEESSVAMAHGYFKVTGKPQMVLVPRHRRPAARHHGDLQRLVRPRAGHHRRRQRSRRRAPAAGRADRSTRRRTSTRWCATSPSGTTTPVSLQHFAQSFVRAYKIAMTPPYEPVMIVARRRAAGRADRRARAASTSRSYVTASPPQAEIGALRETAKLLVERRESGDRRRPHGAHRRTASTLLVELAELLQAPVVEQARPHELPQHASSQPERAAQR